MIDLLLRPITISCMRLVGVGSGTDPCDVRRSIAILFCSAKQLSSCNEASHLQYLIVKHALKDSIHSLYFVVALVPSFNLNGKPLPMSVLKQTIAPK